MKRALVKSTNIISKAGLKSEPLSSPKNRNQSENKDREEIRNGSTEPAEKGLAELKRDKDGISKPEK